MEPTYEDDDYKHVRHIDPLFDGPHNMWCQPYDRGMSHDKIEIECVYFTGSNFSGNNLGFNSDPKRVYPKVA